MREMRKQARGEQSRMEPTGSMGTESKPRFVRERERESGETSRLQASRPIRAKLRVARSKLPCLTLRMRRNPPPPTLTLQPSNASSAALRSLDPHPKRCQCGPQATKIGSHANPTLAAAAAAAARIARPTVISQRSSSRPISHSQASRRSRALKLWPSPPILHLPSPSGALILLSSFHRCLSDTSLHDHHSHHHVGCCKIRWPLCRRFVVPHRRYQCASSTRHRRPNPRTLVFLSLRPCRWRQQLRRVPRHRTRCTFRILLCIVVRISTSVQQLGRQSELGQLPAAAKVASARRHGHHHPHHAASRCGCRIVLPHARNRP